MPALPTGLTVARVVAAVVLFPAPDNRAHTIADPEHILSHNMNKTPATPWPLQATHQSFSKSLKPKKIQLIG